MEDGAGHTGSGSDRTRGPAINRQDAAHSSQPAAGPSQGLPRAHKTPLFPSGYSRSISLPQALHSFTLTGHLGGLSKSKKSRQESTTSADGTLEAASPPSSPRSNRDAQEVSGCPIAAGSASSTSRELFIQRVSDPASSSAVVSDQGSVSRPPSLSHASLSRANISGPSTAGAIQALRSSGAKRTISESHRGLPFVSGPFGDRSARPLGRSETAPHISDILYAGETESATTSPGDGVNPGHESPLGAPQPGKLTETRPNTKSFLQKTSSSNDGQDFLSTPHSFYWETDSIYVDARQPSPTIAARNQAVCVSPSLEPIVVNQNEAVHPPRVPAVQRALSNPDILWCIFDALDAMSVIPREIVPQRRKPLSLRHAQLIFGNDKEAWEAWENSHGSTTTESVGAGLFSCLLVNSTWYEMAVRVLETRVYFSDTEHFTHFTRRGVHHLSRKPRMLVLHKLSDVTQVELDMMNGNNLGECLEWLEFYTCSGLAPPPSLLGTNLQRIILPGCFRVNDRTLAYIGERCPQLEHLDVRACEQISDKGVKIVAKLCPRLQLLNVGRNRGGELITYKGIKHLARQTQLSTLGVAGCYIDDRAIWELALNRGPKLQRLSLNNCHLLTDASVPRVLGYMPNLNVLELRGCTSITYMRPLAIYRAYREKQGQIPLIEGCEVIERRLQVAIMRLQRETSRRVLMDLSTYINGDDQ